MSEQENVNQPQRAGDGDSQGAKKKRRRRGKRRPTQEAGDAQSSESKPLEARPSTAEEDQTESGRSRRRRPKKGPKPESAPSAERTEQPEKDQAEKPVRERPKERPKRGSVLERRRSSTNGDLDLPLEPALPDTPLPEAKSVDAYVKQLRGWQREAIIILRNIVKSQSNEAQEKILWSQPVFTLNGPV